MTTNSYASSESAIKKDFAILSTSCQIVVVNMISGEFKVDKGDAGMVMCKKIKKRDHELSCEFFDTKNKPVTKRELRGVILGQQAILSSESEADHYIISLMTRKVIATSNIYLQDGALRGSKTCSAEFIYLDELNKAK